MKKELCNSNLRSVKLDSLLKLAIFTVPNMYNAAFANRNQVLAQTKQQNDLRVVLLHFEFDSSPVPCIDVASNSSEGQVAKSSKRTDFLRKRIR